MDVWSVVGAISSGVSLSALVAALFMLYNGHSYNQEIRALESLPEAERSKKVLNILDKFEVDAKGLSKSDRFRIASQRLDLATKNSRHRFIQSIVAMFLTALVAIVAIVAESKNINIGIFDGAASAPPTLPSISEILQEEQNELEISSSEGHRDYVGEPVTFALWEINNGELRDAKPDYRVRVRDDKGNYVKVTEGDDFLSLARLSDKFLVEIINKGDPYLNRELLISGHVWKESGCNDRAFFAKAKSLHVSEKDLFNEIKMLSGQSGCKEVDRQLVVWSALEKSLSEEENKEKSVVVEFESILHPKEVVGFNYARSLYKSCISLGYLKQCDESIDRFSEMEDEVLEKVSVARGEAKNAILDMQAKKFMIVHAKVRKKFSDKDYFSAGSDFDSIIANYEKDAAIWSRLFITKNSLLMDAAVSWYNYAYVELISGGDYDKKMVCEALNKAKEYGERSRSQVWLKNFHLLSEKHREKCYSWWRGLTRS